MDTQGIKREPQEKKEEGFHSALQAKEFIDNINLHRTQPGENTQILAATLQSNIHTVFNSAHKYIFELLQNADDAGAKTVVINLQKDKKALLLSHSGDEFLPSDVAKICDNARPTGDKVINPQKTGYKGVGFKANFCISDKITIVSNHVCFRFDGKAVDFNPPEDFPWPIIPIWTNKDEVFRQLEVELPLDQVHFFLERIDEGKVEKEINAVFDSPELLLLLRNIDSVSLPHLGITISREQEPGSVDAEIFKTNTEGEIFFRQVYKIYPFPVNVPSVQKDFLNRLPPSECPQKLKESDHISIVFAVQFELGQDGIWLPMPARNSKLYSYLPTDVKSGLPFFVNGEFLLKQDRGGLLDNDWNAFLIEEIARLQFVVLSNLAAFPKYHSVLLSLMPTQDMSSHQLMYFKSAYASGYSKGLAEQRFIPSSDGELLLLSECVFDQHHFFCPDNGGFSKNCKAEDLFPELFIPSNRVISHQLGPKEELISKLNLLSSQLFSAEKFVYHLPSYIEHVHKDKSKLKRLWGYLIRVNSVSLMNALTEKPWLKLTSSEFEAAEKCFISRDTDGIAGLSLTMSNLSVIDDHILAQDIRANIADWLELKLKVKPVNFLALIDAHYRRLLEENSVDKAMAQEMLGVMYSVFLYDPDALRNILIDFSKIFPIEIGEQRLVIKECLMPSYLLVDASLSTVAVTACVPEDYFSSIYSYEQSKLREFLIAMGVKTQLDFSKVNTVAEFYAHSSFLENYKNHCLKEYAGMIGSGFFRTDRHRLENFYVCEFIGKINQPGYQKIFWKLLIDRFNLISNAAYNPNITDDRKDPKPKFEIISPIIFSLQFEQHFKIRGVGLDRRYCAAQLYIPSFAEKFEGLELPIADIPNNIPQKILGFLGFKLQLTFKDAMYCLENESCKKTLVLKEVYLAVLSGFDSTLDEHVSRINNFIDTKKILTIGGVFQACNNVYWLDFSSDAKKITGVSLFSDCGLSASNKKQLANLFKLKCFTKYGLESLPKDLSIVSSKSDQICLEIKLKVIDFLGYATIVTMNMNDKTSEADFYEIAENYYQKVLNLKLVGYDDLSDLFATKLTVATENSALEAEDSDEGIVLPIVDKLEVVFESKVYNDRSARGELYDAIAQVLFDLDPHHKLFTLHMLDAVKIHGKARAIYSDLTQVALNTIKQFFSQKKQEFQSGQSQAFASSLMLGGQSLSSTSAVGLGDGGAACAPIFSDVQSSIRSFPAFFPASGSKTDSHVSNARKSDGGARSSQIDIAEKNIATGREGESIFFNYLWRKAHDSMRYRNFESTKTSFTATDVYGGILTVSWLNSDREGFQSYDLEVFYKAVDGSEVVRYLFEVKTTSGSSRNAYISRAELKALLNYQENYALVFVFLNSSQHASSEPDIHIRWNPAQKIHQEILELIPTQCKINIDPKRDPAWGKEPHSSDGLCRIS